jgi:hypothetical protein
MINEAFRETMVDVEARMETRVRGADEEGSQRLKTGSMLGYPATQEKRYWCRIRRTK